MEYAQQSCLFNTTELTFINCCRLYLHVTTVSELFNASGTAILPHMFQCLRPPWFNPNHYVTRQRRPSDYQIRKRWQRLCREFCTEDGAIAMSLSFGPRKFKTVGQSLRRESYYVSGIWPMLYHWHEDTYWECHPLATRPGDYLLVQPTSWTPTLFDSPVDAHMITDHSVRLHAPPGIPNAAPRRVIFHDLDDYLQSLPKWEYDVLEGVNFLVSPYALMDHLQRLESSVTNHLAVFNIRADSLATEYMHQHPEPRPVIPLSSAARCHLDLNGKTISSHYTTELRKAAAEPALSQYLRAKHGWSMATKSDVDWTIFCSAARNYTASDVHLLKLVHDKLPTNSHKAKFQPWVTGQCSHCSQRETFDHLMQCTNPMSHDFRLRVLKAIREFGYRRAVPTEFLNTYLEGIEQWLHGHTPTMIHHRLDRAQSAIGWRLFIRGYLSMEWKAYLELLLRSSTSPLDAQHDTFDGTAATSDQDNDSTTSNADAWECYIEMRPSTDTATATAQQDSSAILSGLIRIIWSEMSSFWERHLDLIHAHSERKRSPAKLLEVKTQIQQLHAVRHKVLPDHRDRYFHDNLDAYLEHTDQWKLEQYLLHYKPAILASIRRETTRQNDSTNSIPSILSFAGFTRQPSNSTRPPSILRTPEETPHHKHTRWRPAAALVATFRQFFHPPPIPP